MIWWGVLSNMIVWSRLSGMWIWEYLFFTGIGKMGFGRGTDANDLQAQPPPWELKLSSYFAPFISSPQIQGWIDILIFFVLPPLVQTPTLKLGGRGEGKTWFKFSWVLADLDRKNTDSLFSPSPARVINPPQWTLQLSVWASLLGCWCAYRAKIKRHKVTL